MRPVVVVVVVVVVAGGGGGVGGAADGVRGQWAWSNLRRLLPQPQHWGYRKEGTLEEDKIAELCIAVCCKLTLASVAKLIEIVLIKLISLNIY